ncbi:MAG: hypothetical protein M1837_003625 [Sclerophora amabilis]|nr:MAG: hypothetical protein M1837_003625 [Sclerophora amabilis]
MEVSPSPADQQRANTRTIEEANDNRAKAEVTDVVTESGEGHRADEDDQRTAPDEAEEDARLKELTANVRDQDDLERDVAQQADRLLVEQADERDLRRIEKTQSNKDKLLAQKQHLQHRLSQPTGQSGSARIQAELEGLDEKIAAVDEEISQIQLRIDERHQHDGEGGEISSETAGNRRLPNESRREFLIRTGKITPFSKMGRTVTRSGSTLQDVMLNAEEGDSEVDDEEALDEQEAEGPVSHQNLRLPGFNDEESDSVGPPISKQHRPAKRKRAVESRTHDQGRPESLCERDSDTGEYVGESEDSADAFVPDLDDQQLAASVDLDGEESDLNPPDHETLAEARDLKRKRPSGRMRNKSHFDGVEKEDLRGLDDGNEQLFQTRLKSWVRRRSEARQKAIVKNQPNRGETRDGADGLDSHTAAPDNHLDREEWQLPHPTRADTVLEGGYRMPGDIYPSLFDYQKTGAQWLWELYTQQVGGIIGDEMGLGKTIQVISFLAGLHYSEKLTKPIVVVTPATVMKQWVNEFHRWWPPFRVSILHTSGSGMLNVRGEDRLEQQIEETYNQNQNKGTKNQNGAQKIVDTVVQKGHVLITTYAGLQTYGDLLIPIDWEYAILDEGHKIRNPNTAITIYCKELRTPNRIILSGTPMQNNLTELWSLFDFVFPMRLGTLVNFRNQFEFPIKIGGYANASNLQVQTAIRCAETLKDAISPYLLQRLKVDVASDLPKKSEQVLFCKLTKQQRQQYEMYLGSDDVKAIMSGSLRSFAGISKLRKICNHPDLIDREILQGKPGYHYGSPAKSGKMQVVKALLEVWKKGGHKTLLFAQQRIVLDILEKFVKAMNGFKYRRMDGETQIESRQSLVDEFNNDPQLDVFLLTTKVGGLGINLTGADRVIIFDPDWNPSTDTQARERAWRLGQKREVTIYRLMTAGTIEEKIYHRQLFKQFLANKILKDPKQRQTIPMKDLHDLFSLGSESSGGTETGDLFRGAETQLKNASTVVPESAQRAQSVETNGQSDGHHSSEARGLVGVASLEDFRDEEEEGKRQAGDDARIMEGILAGSGVHSALEHDQVVDGRRPIEGDPKMIEREAKRVAAEAAKSLKKAGEAAKSVPVGTPTWTGQYGVAGRPDPPGVGRGRGRGGPSSASVLARLQDRTASPYAIGHQDSRAGTASPRSRDGTPGPRGQDFMKMIRDFLTAHGGQVRSQMLVDHFNRMCRTPQQTAEFKEMLKQIATLERAGRMRGKWVLKEEFEK